MASQTRTSATNHSGWGSGDGRDYNDNVCRSASGSGWYYAYTYGFTTLGAGDTITGVRVRYHLGAVGWDFDKHDMQLVVGITHKGTAKTNSTMPECTGCTDAGLNTKGDSSDLWGLTAAAMKVIVNNGAFGVAFYNQNTAGNPVHLDGFEITVYYDSVIDAEVTRRAEVFRVLGDEPTRESKVDVVREEDITREAKVIATEVKEPQRESRVYVVREEDYKRESTIDIENLGWTRRAEISHVAADDVKRESEVTIDNLGWTRRAQVISTAVEDVTRRSEVIHAGVIDDQRESNVRVPYEEEVTRRGEILPAFSDEVTRRAEVWIEAFDQDDRRAKVRVTPEQHTRRSRINPLEEEDLTRRGEVRVTYTVDITRESNILVAGAIDATRRAVIVGMPVSQMRRSRVTVAYDWTRRATVYSYLWWFYEERTRRSIVTVVPYEVDSTRRSKVKILPPFTVGYTRRAQVSIYVVPRTRRAIIHVNMGWLYEERIRRGKVFATRGWYTRRAIVYVVDHVGNYTRRSILASTATSEDARRAKVKVYWYFIINEEIRRSTVHVWTPDHRRSEVTIWSDGWTRKAEVRAKQLHIINRPVRRSIINVYHPDDTRRSIVTVTAAHIINEGIRRSILIIEGGVYTRRAIVTATAAHNINDDIRRAILYVEADHVRRSIIVIAKGEDYTRRSTVTSLGTELVRRARVTVWTEAWLYVDEIRRSIIYVEQSSYTRRSTVTHAAVPEETRRAIVDTFDWVDRTRRSKVRVFSRWFYGWKGRRSVVYSMVIDEDTRRGKVFVVLLGDITRRSIVLVEGEVDINRKATLFVFKPSDVTRRGTITSAQKPRLRLRMKLYER